MNACPGCGTPTEPVTLRYGSGMSVEVTTAAQWCSDCLASRCAKAREDRDCHCAEVPGVHRHESRPNERKRVPSHGS